MKFGCCLNMVSSIPGGTGIEYINKLSELGYDYAELPLAEMMNLSEEDFHQLRSHIGKSGIKCEVCNNFFPGTYRLTGNNVDFNKIMTYVENALSRAMSLGVQYVVFGSGKAKNVPENFPLEQGYLQVVDLLKMVGPIAQKNNITIVIEPLNKGECNLINTFAEGCKLAKDVDHNNVKVLVDFYHLSVEQEPVENVLKEGRTFLRHVHFANPNGRVYPELMKEYNYKPFIDTLKKIGYEERISCEAYVQDFDRQALEAIRFFKNNF